MVTVETLLETSLPWEVARRALPDVSGEVVKVSMVEDLDRLDLLGPGSVLVLTRSTIEPASGYQLDVFVRQCVQRGVVAIMLRRSTPRSLTAEALAARGGVALLDLSDEVDPAAIVDELPPGSPVTRGRRSAASPGLRAGHGARKEVRSATSSPSGARRVASASTTDRARPRGARRSSRTGGRSASYEPGTSVTPGPSLRGWPQTPPPARWHSATAS